MIAFENEGIPTKEDTAVVAVGSSIIKKSQSNLAINQQINDNPNTKSTSSTATSTNSQGMFRSQFQQKRKILRDIWSQHQSKITRENGQLFFIIWLSVLGAACSIVALTSSRWSCDAKVAYGLWNSCYQPITDGPLIAPNSTNLTIAAIQPVRCVQQDIGSIVVSDWPEQTRVDKIYASQGLIVTGVLLYFFSLITIGLAYRFIQTNSLNLLRNALVASVFIQFIAYFLLLVGFYLFILTEQFSISVGLLFVYFGIVMFASNLINFITVEYKSFKKRPSISI